MKLGLAWLSGIVIVLTIYDEVWGSTKNKQIQSTREQTEVDTTCSFTASILLLSGVLQAVTYELAQADKKCMQRKLITMLEYDITLRSYKSFEQPIVSQSGSVGELILLRSQKLSKQSNIKVAGEQEIFRILQSAS